MQTEKSSASMFAANRVNNGQSHSLDSILIITFLLDIARHVINFEVCADWKRHNQGGIYTGSSDRGARWFPCEGEKEPGASFCKIWKKHKCAPFLGGMKACKHTLP